MHILFIPATFHYIFRDSTMYMSHYLETTVSGNKYSVLGLSISIRSTEMDLAIISQTNVVRN